MFDPAQLAELDNRYGKRNATAAEAFLLKKIDSEGTGVRLEVAPVSFGFGRLNPPGEASEISLVTAEYHASVINEQREQISNQGAQIAEQSTQIAEQTAQIGEQDVKIEEQSAAIATLNEAIQTQQQAIDDFTATYEDPSDAIEALEQADTDASTRMDGIQGTLNNHMADNTRHY